MIEEHVLLLSASKWDFVDDNTGDRRKGLTVYVCHLNQTNDNINGIKPAKYTLSSDNMHILDDKNLPALGVMVADFDFTRSKITPTSFKDLNSVKLGDLAHAK